jgi:hypothetical protein
MGLESSIPAKLLPLLGQSGEQAEEPPHDRRAGDDGVERRGQRRRIEDIKPLTPVPPRVYSLKESELHREIESLERAVRDRDAIIEKQVKALEMIRTYARTHLFDNANQHVNNRAVYKTLKKALIVAEVDVDDLP